MRWAAFVLLLTGCSASGTELNTAQGRVTLDACQIGTPPEAALCGAVRVRESAAGTRTIDLRVIVLKARTPAPLPDPIVPLVGGPGQGAADLAASLASRYSVFRDQRDIVFIDQRGTGASNGLQCDERHSTASLMGRIFDAQHLARCRAELEQHADLTRYTTAAAAADNAAVFDQLGYDTVNLVGTSYGSRMALEIARQFPSRVRTMTIEGIAPMNFDWPTGGAPDFEGALNALIDDCESDPPCAAMYPRFRQDIDVAFARLRRDPVAAVVRDQLTGSIEPITFGLTDLAYATRGILYGNDALSLPLWFRAAAEGDFTAFAQAYVTRARNLDAGIARGLLLAVYCSEDLPFVDWTAAARSAEGTRMGTFLLDQYRLACDGWPRADVGAAFKAPVTSNVPTLIMAGRRDPVTPPRTAIDASRTLTRSKLLIWEKGGHGTDGLASTECRTSIQREFLRTANPETLATGCATRDAARPWH